MPAWAREVAVAGRVGVRKAAGEETAGRRPAMGNWAGGSEVMAASTG